MPQLVSTGQITIVDNNDARSLTAFITASQGLQQVYSKDESTISFTPNWTSTNNVLTAKVYAGGPSVQDVTAQLTNRRWSNDLSTSIGSGTTLTVNTNLTEAAPNKMYYFEGDYTDPTTGLVSRIIAQISLNLVKTGTNAVYILTRGKTAIEQATGATKSVAVVAADLVRASGIDTSGVTYRFYENFGATQVISTMTTKYGLKTSAAGSAPTGSASDINVNLPASGAWSAHNTLVIHESAVADMGVYRVEAKDADGTIYQAYFTIYDVTDPYEVRVISSSGDKLQNGQGSTNLTPEVFYGATKVSSLTSWTFDWTLRNRDGKPSAFVDATKTALAGGRDITAQPGTGTSTVFTYSGTAITFAAGQLIKCVLPSGVERIYEVASGTGNTVTMRAPTTHSSWLLLADHPAPSVASEFVGGKLFACVAGQSVQTSAGAALLVTGDDIDVKGTIYCSANRP